MEALKSQLHQVYRSTCIAAALAVAAPFACGQVTVFGLLDAGLVSISADGVVAKDNGDDDRHPMGRHWPN